jgi:GTPase SAR1 family protein
MGCQQSSPEAQDAKRKSRMLEDEIDRQAKQEAEKVKLLLLGAGESGKSTVFKQMKVIYGEKYTDAERKQAIPTIHSNVVQAINSLCEQAFLFNLVSLFKATTEFDMIRALDENDAINVEIGSAISALWTDPGLKAVWERRSEFQLIESVQYYFNKIDTIKMPDYMPDKDDILFSRVRTSGIVTERYNIDGTNFEIYDVGGQRNERKKWIHCFEGVTAVIFVAAISEYDQKLFEDASTNRMVGLSITVSSSI